MGDAGFELLHELAFEARASALTEMRRQVSQILAQTRLRTEDIESIVLALNEACMNVIQHAYRGDSCKPIRLCIEPHGDEVHFELLDCAPPVDLAQVRGRAFEELRPGGLGVRFIDELMHDVRYSHRTESAGNCLRMTWKPRPETQDQ